MLDLLVVSAPLTLRFQRVNHGPGVAAQDGGLDLVLGDVDGLLAGLVGNGGEVRAALNTRIHRLVRNTQQFRRKVDFATGLAQGIFNLLDCSFPDAFFHSRM